MSYKRTIVIALAWAMTVGAAARGQDRPAEQDGESSTKPSQASAVSLAVLDYDARLPGNEKLGSQMADILTARLSIENSLKLVERADLDKVISEHQLALTGLVDEADSAKVGRLVGARILLTGKAFVLDKDLLVVTKIIGVETGRVVGTIRKVDLSKSVSEVVMLVAEDVAELIRDKGSELLAKDSKMPDPLADIRKRLGEMERPTVAVIVVEDHHRRPDQPRVVVIDPAAETEIKRSLLACGFKVVDTGENDLADWARSYAREQDRPWPAAIAEADFVVVGEAFSEFAMRTGDLVTCTARAEVNLIERGTGRILLAERHTTRAVDLAENTAGKTALQQAGSRLGVQIARALAEHVVPEPDQDQEKDAP